jgi:ribosomal protein L9
MKVILKEDVQNLGQQGDVVEVKAGYARNYLMPQKLAILFTKQQKKSIEESQRAEERKLERNKGKLESVLKQVEALSLTIKMQSGEDNKLFGSVTKLDIVKLLEENGIAIDKKYVDFSTPIKTLGEHKFNTIFTKEISGSFTLTVEKEN